MRAARSKPEDHVAGPDRAPVDNTVLLDHPDAEARQIVFARGIHARHFRRLTANQRATGQFTAARDAADHVRGDPLVELAARVVVEKEKRLGALREHIVDAHRHQVDANRVVTPEREGELELRADAVGPRHEHRVTVFLRDLAQRAETADAGEHLGPQRAPGERLDRLDQRVAGLDVDAGVAVGKSFRHARVQILLDMPALASPQLWAWITIALAAGFLVWLLSPILAPFLFAAVLAYIFDPLVERLTRHRVPRTLAVVLVLLLAVAVAVAMMLVVLPLFYKETRLLMEKLPGFVAWAKARAMAAEVDAVLAQWLRGQVLVIAIMSVYYVLALWLARLEFALPIGILTGLAVIVPYVGVVTGLILATLTALMQFDDPAGLLWAWLAIGIGQGLEAMVVTPLIVGERIGLHPVVVIFALLAFGQVFGFFGVLLALPASAALLVGLRHLRAAYLASRLHGGN